ncbi:MAG TPA: hypothetical protein VFG45_00985 [Candidatus Nitrosocosmicus sp.]|nr:hypothetical protein [Candidatus Nitrosocosmicus sp.]
MNEGVNFRDIRKFELYSTSLKTVTIKRTFVDWNREIVEFQTCDGSLIEIGILGELSYLPKLVEDHLYFYNVPGDEIQQIVNRFEELVHYPLCEVV